MYFRSGNWYFTKLIQPGQHEVRIGRFSLAVIRLMISFASSMMVRSAPKVVSNTASKPILAQPGHQLARDGGADRDPEFLADGSADGRRDLNDHRLAGVEQGCPGLGDVAVAGERGGGAHADALAAVGAVGVDQRLHFRRRDNDAEAAAIGRQRVHRLHLVAHRLAAPAADAFLGVAFQRAAGLVDGIARLLAVIALRVDAELPGQRLQLAVGRLGAGEAGERVVGEQQLQQPAPCEQHPFRVGRHLHALSRGRGARGRQVATPFHFDAADAARGGPVHHLQLAQVEVAEGRDADVDLAGSIQDRSAIRD